MGLKANFLDPEVFSILCQYIIALTLDSLEVVCLRPSCVVACSEFKHLQILQIAFET